MRSPRDSLRSLEVRRPRAVVWRSAVLVFITATACDAPEVIERRSAAEVTTSNAPEGALSDPETTALVREADAMREALEGRRPPISVVLQLARMYETAGRYPDAIDWYRRAIEEAGPFVDELEALVETGTEEAADVPAGCLIGAPGSSFESASARAGALLEDGERSAALACYRAALYPIAGALWRRGAAWNAMGNRMRALEHMEEALVLAPDDRDMLFTFGAMAFEVEPEMLSEDQARRARAAWKRLEEIEPDHPLTAQVREALVHVDSLMEQGRFTAPPAGAPKIR